MIKNAVLNLIILSCCSISFLSCQTPLRSGIINYQVDLQPNEDGIAMKEAFTDGAKVYFNSNYIKLVKDENNSTGEFTITDLKKQEESTYLEVMDNRFAVLFDQKHLPKIGSFQIKNEFKTIAGFRCQKAEAPMGDGLMTVYFSKEIKVDYCPYVNLEGFALEYSLAMPYGQLTYTAQEVIPQNFSNEEILPIEKYESIKMDDFGEVMTKLMGGESTKGTSIEFSKISLDDNLISNTTLEGSVVVINFWFTSCAPCKVEIPDLNQLKSEYKNKPVRFIAITFDPKDIVLDFMDKTPFDYEMITDARDLSREFQVKAYPTTMILDKNGIIVHRITGGSSNIIKELKPLIETELNKDR